MDKYREHYRYGPYLDFCGYLYASIVRCRRICAHTQSPIKVMSQAKLYNLDSLIINIVSEYNFDLELRTFQIFIQLLFGSVSYLLFFC